MLQCGQCYDCSQRAAEEDHGGSASYSSALPSLEELAFQLQIVRFGEFGGSHADVLYMADEVALREARVVHGSRIPHSL
jgi:hypothetical protein